MRASLAGLLARCVHCRARPRTAVGLCQHCHDRIAPAPPAVCSVCGLELHFSYEVETLESYRCGDCIKKSPPFDQMRFALYYDGIARELLLRLKFRGERSVARTLAELGREALLPFMAELNGAIIVPTPLAIGRLYTRGYNPSYLIARRFGAWLDIPVMEGALRRTRKTAPQFGLSASQRARNVKGAFAVADPSQVAGQRVILFDDVYTTGATVAECCKALKKARPEIIVVATLLKTE